jgi:hypothetical protein
METAARVTTVLSADWKPATRTLPVRSSAIAASSSSADLIPAQNLHGSPSQELTGRRQPDAATDPLGQRHPDVRLESREMVAN